MQPSGTPRTELTINDLSILVNTGLKGIIGVTGITQFGIPNKPVTVGSWIEFNREFGGLLDGISDFPHLCKRALDRGGRLKVSRGAHYTTITDPTTIVGSKATITVGTSPTQAIWTATSIGTWANGITVTTAAAANNLANTVDITVTFAAQNYVWVYPNFPSTAATPTNVLAFNAASKYVTLSLSANGNMPVNGVATLAAGAEDKTLITSTDLIGSSLSNTGLYSFDSSNEIVKIAIPEMASNAIDIAVTAYVEARKDLLGMVRTPINIDGNAAVNFRNAVSPYAGTASNSWRVIGHTYGGLDVPHPITGLSTQISEIGDVIGIWSNKDNIASEWYAAAGPKRGLINNVNGVLYNVGSAARQTQADAIDNNGLNPVINHVTFGPILWGNNTLYKTPSLLRHANVAELMIALYRNLIPLVQTEMFEPNDIDTWKTVWRNVTPYMDYVQTNRGIWKYLYQGDQDIDDISQAVVNSPNNIDAGMYIFNLWIAPKVAQKYQGIQVNVTNSSIDFTTLAGQPS